ncbi:MAG: hypothetical protein CR981_00805 [Proteobacteria bacterium]|nr:MAG: hypothetical protein CR981_00805 [Pseudomonadota bacterium]
MRSNEPIDKHFFTSQKLRITILGLMVIAFLFGFADQIWDKNFERLHIFLFNLCAGGFVIVYHTENSDKPSTANYLFLFLSLLYAVTAFFHWYVPAALLSFTLGLLVESIRIRCFQLFPADIFALRVSVVDKFHHASILCLSMSLFIATFVLLNGTVLHWIHNSNLTLDVFFLGYSFPVSLITMSVMFSFVRQDIGFGPKLLKQLFFWLVNLGVIIFFLFIINEMKIAEIIIASLLFLTVAALFTFFLLWGIKVQQKLFLLSGMVFLLFTGITGIQYIFLAAYPDTYAAWGKLLLSGHAYLALYGWGLSGLLILIRWNDFPLKLNSWRVILMHWVVIAVLAPLGKGHLGFALAASVSFCLFLHFFFEETETVSLHMS